MVTSATCAIARPAGNDASALSSAPALISTARSLGRHRARSSALLAAVVATTAAGVAIGSFAEGELTNDALHRGQDRDARALGDECAGASEPDATGSTRDDDDFVLQLEIHQ